MHSTTISARTGTKSIATRQRRILVIEDQAEIRALIAIFLEELACDLEFAVDGEAGLEMAKKRPPDLILLDIMMPKMHGYQVLQALRKHPATQRTAILVVSAKAYGSDHRKALEMGAAAILQKPFNAETLRAAVQKQLQKAVVRFWGVRGSIAAPGPDTVQYGGNTPCVTLDHEGTQIILDAGTGIRALGVAMQSGAAGQPLDVNLLITHTHWDHIQGFPFFAPAFVPGNRIHVYGPHSTEKPLEKVLRGQMDHEYFPVALGDMAAEITVTDVGMEPFQVGPFQVRATYMNHPGMTLGYRLEVAGLVVAYATDTEPFRTLLPATVTHDGDGMPVVEFARTQDRELVELVRGADVYIADAQYSPEEYAKKTGWGHTNYVDAVEIALEAGVKRLVLFSHDPMHNDQQIDQKLAHCRALVAQAGRDVEVIAAREGEPIELFAEVAARGASVGRIAAKVA